MSTDIDRLLENTEAYPRAFPFVVRDGDYSGVVTGLTKREYYACAAMQGLCCHPAMANIPHSTAIIAVELADALMDQLSATERCKGEDG